MRFERIVAPAAALAALLLPALAAGASGAEILKEQCAACHALSKPEDTSLERLLSRKGPDLYYAGVKFQRDWLVRWLQEPSVIRPAGVMYRNVVKAGEPGTPDVVDAALLPAHPRLGADDAAAAADALLSLGVDSGLVQQGAYAQQKPNPMMAALLFNKLRGCSSCHADKPGGPARSAAELFTGGERLQPDFVVEYIRNPQKFDPHIWMPRLVLNETDIQRLAGYVMTLRQEGGK